MLIVFLVAKIGQLSLENKTNTPSGDYQDVVNGEFSIVYQHLRNQLDDIFMRSQTYQEKQHIIDDMQALIDQLGPKNVGNAKAPTLATVHKGRPKLQKRNRVGVEIVKDKLKDNDKEKAKKRKNENKESAESRKKTKIEDETGTLTIDQLF